MPIMFQCSCGKRIKTPDELVGKSVKCPGCGRIIKVPQPKVKQAASHIEILPSTGDKLITPPQEKETKTCPNCGTQIYEGDAVCVTCGRQLASLGPSRRERRRSFLQHPLFRLGISIVALVIIALVVYINFFKKPAEEEASGNGKSRNPAEVLSEEIANANLDNFEPLVKALVGAEGKALPILQTEFQKANRGARLKAIYGMLILAYYGRFDRKEVYYELDSAVRDPDDNIRKVVLDIFYLITAAQPEFGFIQRSDEIKKYKGYFGKVSKRAASISQARNSLRRFLRDKNELIRAKAIGYLVLLGDKSRIDALAGFLKSEDTEVKAQTTSFLTFFTGQIFKDYKEWGKWRLVKDKKPQEKKE